MDPLGEKGKQILAQKKQVIEKQKREIMMNREKYRRPQEITEEDADGKFLRRTGLVSEERR